MRLKTYEIECDFCGESSRITLLTRPIESPEYCPMCGNPSHVIFVDALEEDSDG